MRKNFLSACILISILSVISPQSVFASGIGFQNFNGDVTITNTLIRNNSYGIASTTTNAASVQNIWIFSNSIEDSLEHGIAIDSSDSSGGVTIRNNYLDNTNVPNTGPNTAKGRFGIRIQNSPNPSVSNNTVQNFGRSGIQMRSIANITLINNYLHSNGSQDLFVNSKHYASGLQAIDSTFANVSYNIIVSNQFSGIGAYSTGGTIDSNNIIRYNGDIGLPFDNGSGDVGGACLSAGGSVQGGILIKGLDLTETLEYCGNSIYSNRNKDVAKFGGGTVTDCGVALPQKSFFTSKDNGDAKIYIDEDTGDIDINCEDTALLPPEIQASISNATVDAALGGSSAFGILVLGGDPSQKVTIRNCSIKNAAMDTGSRVAADDGGTTRYIGAGIFLVNNASPWIYSNYIYSNGWALLDDKVYTNAGSSGIQMRCADQNTSIYNNIIASNKNDGLVARQTGGYIGVSGSGNTFRNNGRGGIGIYNGTTSNILVTDNAIHSNKRGIGVFGFSGDLLKISDNYIYSNKGGLTSAGGIAIKDLAAAIPVTIQNNTISQNSGWKVGGIGLLNASLSPVDLSIFSNTISNNKQSGIGMQYAEGFTIRNNVIYSNSGNASDPASDEYYSFGIQIRDSSFYNNSVELNTIHSNKFAGIGVTNSGGTIGPNNSIRFNGDPNAAAGGSCSEIGGTGRGGVSAKDLSNDLFAVGNTVTGNYVKEYQSGTGSVAKLYDDSGQSVSNAFWDRSQVGWYVKGVDTFINNTTINAGAVWGVAAVGPYDVTITNSTIINNCTAANCEVDGKNGEKFGGGILIAGGATLSMSNTYVANNGSTAFQKGIGGAGGVVMRCAGTATNLHDNTIRSNANDGVVLYDTDGFIGLAGKANSIWNNGRNGIGISSYDGSGLINGGPSIAYNAIYSNTTFGIGSWGLTAMNATISNNIIYSNHKANALGTAGADIGGGIGFDTLSSLVLIENNTVRNNPGPDAGGIGIIGPANLATISIMNNVVFGNESLTSGPGGIGLRDLDPSAIVRIQGNSIYNNKGWKAAGIGVTNTNATILSNVDIYSNEIFANEKSGLGIWNGSLINIQNNFIISNGWLGTQSGDEVYGSGIQLKNGSFDNSNITGNTINSNWFAGIALYSTVGSIGGNNSVVYNGIYSPSFTGGGGGLTDCVQAAGGAGDIRGGVLVRGLTGGEEISLDCTNDVSGNFHKDVAKTGSGTFTSCTNAVTSFFASNADASFYFDDSSGHVELDCTIDGTGGYYPHNGKVNAGVIDAAGLPFGIIIVGRNSDVTVTNCTVQNAAMDENSIALVNNNGETRYIGAGIFISNNAAPSISNNYIFSNGWGVLDDQLYTTDGAGASGIQMRCAGDTIANKQATIVNNLFQENKNDALVARETGGIIGLVNQGNTFNNNGRAGIGIMDGTTRNLEIAYNTFTNNQRGIGAIDFDGILLKISNNYIFSNADTASSPGGIGLKNLSAAAVVTIDNNIIHSNSGWKIGGIGLTSNNPAITTVNLNIFSNTITNSQQSGIGIEWAKGFTIRNNYIVYNGQADYLIEGEYHSFGIQVRNSTFTNGSVTYNTIESSWFAGIGAYDSGGVIGPYNAVQNNGLGAGAGGLCTGVGGTGRGGISAKDLMNNGELNVDDPTNLVVNNNPKDLQQNPGSTFALKDNGSPVSSTYWANSNVAMVITSDTTIDGQVFSNGDVWGVTVVGPYTVTIRNSTIKNNCTNSGTCNIQNPDGQDIGGGVLIAGGANVYLDSNVIVGNGVNSQIFSNGGYSGVAMRCASSDTKLVGNIIASNANDGIALYDTNGYVGLPGLGNGNIIRDNGRNGIGMRSFAGGTNDGPMIANNRISSNAAYGIGSWGLVNMNASISNNIISSNHLGPDNTLGVGGTDIGGGIGLNGLSSIALIDGNIIRNNRGSKGGGVGISASDGAFSLTNNLIENNISSDVGGMGLNDLSSAEVYVYGNRIVNNFADKIGAVGVSMANGTTTYSFINNTISDNIGSSGDANLANIGGVGFRELLDTNTKIYFSGNTLRKNRANNPSPPAVRGRVGAIGVSNSNAEVSIVNNTIGNNDGRCIGGVGFDSYSGDAWVLSNLIYGNANQKSDFGAGGLAFDFISGPGKVTVSNNKIYNNKNTATGSGGIGVNEAQSTAFIYFKENSIYNNSGIKAGGIGVANATTENITIFSNEIFNNHQFGIGILNGSFLNIRNNSLVNNGTDNTKIDDEHYASGMQLRDATFLNNDVANNVIINNKFAGIQARNTGGTIGPNNYIRYNGNSDEASGGACAGIGGTGAGGVSARDLNNFGDLFLVGNTITSNTTADVQIKPGSSQNLTVENQKKSSTLLTEDMVAWYVKGIGNDTFINNTTINAGKVWGVAAIGAYDVTITNSTIENNCNNSTDCDLVIDGHNVGGGILIAGGATISMDNVYVNNNGYSSQVEGEGGFAGVAIRCSDESTTIINSHINGNANDGIALYDTKGFIGLVGEGNIIEKNRRHGIGLSSFAGGGVKDEGPEISYNTISSNTAFGIGGYNLTNMNATISNNTIDLNHSPNSLGVGGVSDIGGGIGITGLKTLAIIEYNTIINNPGSITGAVGVTGADGTVIIKANEIYGNSSSATGSGGIGLADLGANASVQVEGNSIYNNGGILVSGIGVTNSNTSLVNIIQNDIYGNDRSGIGVFASSFINIQDNRVLSNGWAVGDNFTNSAGIQLRQSTFANGDVSNNIIRDNKYAGLLAYSTPGFIGPNNVIQNNGDSGGTSGCAGLQGPGAGDGGIAVRGLSGGDTLIFSRNVVDGNNVGIVTVKECVGSVVHNSEDLVATAQCGSFVDSAEVFAYVQNNGTVFDGTTINAAGYKWGIGIMGLTGITIKNSTIYNATQGGILVGPNSEAYIDNNYIYNNGSGSALPYGDGADAGVVLRCAAAGTQLSNNVIELNYNDGINIKDSDGTVGVLGGGNTINNNGRFGIGVAGSAVATIAYNDVNNNTDKGIGVTGYGIGDVSILNNEVYGNTNQGLGFGGGVADSGSASASANTSIVTLANTASIIKNKYTGMILKTNGTPEYVFITGYTGGAAKAATVDQNWVSAPSTYEVITASAAAAYAENNNIYNNGQGIGIGGAGPGSNIHVNGNTITGNNPSQSVSLPGGVGVQGGQPGAYVLVENNTIDANKGPSGIPGGIGINASSGQITFSNNQITNSTGSGAAFQGLLDGADVLIFSNTIDGNNATGGTQAIGGVGIQDLRDGSYIDVNGNNIINNSGSAKTAGLGIRQTSAYSGAFGFVRVSNNTFDNNTTTGGTSRVQVVGVGNDSTTDKVQLTSDESGIEIIRNVINCNNVLAGVGLTDITGGDDSTRFGRVYVRENYINNSSVTGENFGIRVNDATSAIGSGPTDFVSLFIQNNRNVDGGMGFGSCNGCDMYLGEFRVSGNTLRNIPTTATNPEAAIVFDNYLHLYPSGNADGIVGVHVSGNVFENLDSGAV